MAYERYTEDPGDELARQLEQQQMRTQPMGTPSMLGSSAYRAGSVDPRDADPASGYGPGGVLNPAYRGGVSTGSGDFGAGARPDMTARNTGVAGGKSKGTPTQSGAAPGAGQTGGMAPVPGGAMARYGVADIADAKDLAWGSTGRLEGFNTNDWGKPDVRGNHTIKNTFGKIASRYDPTQPGAAKAVMADPDFQRFFPEAKLVEHPNGDLIDFGDGKPVDVLRAAVAGGAGEAWQWGADDGTGGGGGGGDMGGGGGLDMNRLIAGITGGDPLGGIQSELDELINGQDPQSQTLIQKILAGEVQI